MLQQLYGFMKSKVKASKTITIKTSVFYLIMFSLSILVLAVVLLQFVDYKGVVCQYEQSVIADLSERVGCQYEQSVIADLSEPTLPRKKSLDAIKVVTNTFGDKFYGVFTDEFIMKTVSDAFASNHSSPSEAVEQIRAEIEKKKNHNGYSTHVTLSERSRKINTAAFTRVTHEVHAQTD